MTQEQKTLLEGMRAGAYDYMNSLSQDFVNDHALSDSCYISDAITEYADGAISVYYRDQYNYYVDHSEECENALLELYDGDSIAQLVKSEGLYNLCCKAGVCGAFQENERELYDDIEKIKICLIIDYCLNCDIFLTAEQIEEIAQNDFDRFDDYADQVNEIIKEEK